MRKINFNDFTLVPSERRLLCASQDVMLNPKAFDLLTILAENPGQVLTKEEIIERLWPDSAVEEGNLAVQISHLRAALRFFSEDPIIRTVPGVGYCFAMGISETEDGAIDTRCNHRGRCAGLVIIQPPIDDVSQKTIRLVIDCLENAASERDEIHLYSRKPHRGIQRANGGLFLEIRVKQVETLGKFGIALEFTNPSTEEVRFRVVLSDREFKTVDLGMDVARKVMKNFSDRVLIGWTHNEEIREASSRNLIDNMVTQAAFLIEVETLEAATEADALVERAIEFDASGARLHLMKMDIQILKSLLANTDVVDVLETSKTLLERASRTGASEDGIVLARAKIRGLLSGEHAKAIELIRTASDSDNLSKSGNILMADLLSHLNRLEEAKLSLQTALEQDPLSFSAMRRLAKCHFALGDIESAKKSALSLLRFLPFDELAISLIQACGDDSARPQELKAPSSSSGNGSAQTNPGASKRKRGGELRDKRGNFLAVQMIKESIGDRDSALAYKRLIKLLDEENVLLPNDSKRRQSDDTPLSKVETKNPRGSSELTESE
jgi:DNA-binding winged helix-turn-helix (wHTH) protein/tetratricopeptide (TPR) repeat protein